MSIHIFNLLGSVGVLVAALIVVYQCEREQLHRDIHKIRQQHYQRLQLVNYIQSVLDTTSEGMQELKFRPRH